jgi:hypothetical protein
MEDYYAKSSQEEEVILFSIPKNNRKEKKKTPEMSSKSLLKIFTISLQQEQFQVIHNHLF